MLNNAEYTGAVEVAIAVRNILLTILSSTDLLFVSVQLNKQSPFIILH